MMALMVAAALASAAGSNWAFESHVWDNGELAHFAVGKSLDTAGQAPMALTIMRTPRFAVMGLMLGARLTSCKASCVVTLTSAQGAVVTATATYKDGYGEGGAAFYELPKAVVTPVLDAFGKAGRLYIAFRDDPAHRIYRFSYVGYDPDAMQ